MHLPPRPRRPAAVPSTAARAAEQVRSGPNPTDLCKPLQTFCSLSLTMPCPLQQEVPIQVLPRPHVQRPWQELPPLGESFPPKPCSRAH